MAKVTKILFIIATTFVVLGLFVVTFALVQVGFDLEKISTEKFQTLNYTFDQPISDVTFDIENSDVVFEKSQTETCSVECFENVKISHSVSVENGNLTVKAVDNRKWYDFIGISFKRPKITVYLPNANYNALNLRATTGDVTMPKTLAFKGVEISVTTGSVKCYSNVELSVKISATTGSVWLENVNCGIVDIGATTGHLYLNDVNCGQIKTKTTTGGVSGKNLIAQGLLQMESTTGGIRLERCDAQKVDIKATTGSIYCSFLTPKIFMAQSSTGAISAPQSAVGGECKATTSTGSITLRVV